MEEVLRDERASTLTVAYRKNCIRLGMLPEALYAWENLHRQTQKAMLLFFSSWAIQLCGVAYIIHGVAKYPSWLVYAFQVPLGIGLVGDCCQVVGYWRLGPLLLQTAAFKRTFHFFMIISFVSQLLGFSCPEEIVPTGSTVVYTVVVALRTLASNQALALMPHKKPDKAFESVNASYVQASVSTIKTMDACTDVAFIRVLNAEVAAGCFWFGTPGKCLRYKVMQAALCVCALSDLAVTVTLSFVKAGADLNNGLFRRKLMRLYVMNLIFELGIMSVCVLNLWSSFQRPGRESGGTSELAMMFVSIAITLMTFSLTVYGTGSVLTGARLVINRISLGGMNARMSAAGARVAPTPGAYDAVQGGGDLGGDLQVLGVGDTQERGTDGGEVKHRDTFGGRDSLGSDGPSRDD